MSCQRFALVLSFHPLRPILLSSLTALIVLTNLSAPAQTTVFDPPGSVATYPSSINASGEIVGWYFSPDEAVHAFLRKADGTIANIDPPGTSGNAWGYGINDAGYVTGEGIVSGLADGFIRSPGGTYTTFDVSGAEITAGIAINPTDTVAGNWVAPVETGEFGFLRTPGGGIVSFGYPGATFSLVVGINASNTIAGFYLSADFERSHGFVRFSDGDIVNIDPPGSLASTPSGINASGEIIGQYAADGVYHGYMRSPSGTFTTFDPPNSQYTQPSAMNDTGAITGIYRNGNVYLAFLRLPSGAYVTFGGTGGYAPSSINSSNTITGAYTDAAGVVHGFVRQN